MENINFEDEIKNILTNKKGEIKASMQAELMKSLTSKISYSVDSELSKVTTDFVEKEIVPELKKILLDTKQDMINELQKGIIASVSELAKGMMLSASKNFKDEYNTKKVVKSLFDIY